jgi:hypothetical protein
VWLNHVITARTLVYIANSWEPNARDPVSGVTKEDANDTICYSHPRYDYNIHPNGYSASSSGGVGTYTIR